MELFIWIYYISFYDLSNETRWVAKFNVNYNTSFVIELSDFVRMPTYNLDGTNADGKRIILETNNATILAILDIDVVIRTETVIVILIEDKFFLDYFIT